MKTQNKECVIHNSEMAKIAMGIADDSGESIVKFGKDDTTRNCAGTVAANFVYYFRNLK